MLGLMWSNVAKCNQRGGGKAVVAENSKAWLEAVRDMFEIPEGPCYRFNGPSGIPLAILESSMGGFATKPGVAVPYGDRVGALRLAAESLRGCKARIET